MTNRTKRISLSKVPGAKENQVKWLRCCGVRTAAEARKAAGAFISDLEKRKKGGKGAPKAKKAKK